MKFVKVWARKALEKTLYNGYFYRFYKRETLEKIVVFGSNAISFVISVVLFIVSYWFFLRKLVPRIGEEQVIIILLLVLIMMLRGHFENVG